MSNSSQQQTYSTTSNLATVNSTSAVNTITNGTGSFNGTDVFAKHSLEYRLANIEKVLGIPEANFEMFNKYPKLKQKYDDYINELAKLKTWEVLKADQTS